MAELVDALVSNTSELNPRAGSTPAPGTKSSAFAGDFYLLTMAFVYIIYSSSLDKFYIGSTTDLEARLMQHNSSFFKQSYTAKTNDWELFYSIECDTLTQSLRIEKHLKQMKSRKYILSLKNNEQKGRNLLLRFK